MILENYLGKRLFIEGIDNAPKAFINLFSGKNTGKMLVKYHKTNMNNLKLEDLIADIDFFDNWEDKYKYIIELGKNCPSFR